MSLEYSVIIFSITNKKKKKNHASFLMFSAKIFLEYIPENAKGPVFL